MTQARYQVRRTYYFAILIMLPLPAQSIFGQVQHPLDPLTAEEIKLSTRILTAAPQFPKEAIFSTIVLKEPSKSEVINYRMGTPFSRQAFAVILDRKNNHTFEAVVDLKA